MKNFKALRVSALFTLVLFAFSCSKSPDIKPPPVEPPVVLMPVINSFTPKSSDTTINYNGMTDGKVNFSWNTSNGSTYFAGKAVSPSGSQDTVVGYTPKSFSLSVTNSKGEKAEQTKNVSVTFDPTLMKFASQAGTVWKIVKITLTNHVSGNVNDVTTTCAITTIYTYYPNGDLTVNFGNNSSCLQGINHEKFFFNPASMKMNFPTTAGQVVQDVSFPVDGKMNFSTINTQGDLVVIYHERQ